MNRYRVTWCADSVTEEFRKAKQPLDVQKVRAFAYANDLFHGELLYAYSADDARSCVQSRGLFVIDVECSP